MSDSTKKIYTLSDVAKAIKNTLAPVAARRFWIHAEVTQPREADGHMYAVLVEVVHGKQVAKLSCAIWHDRLVSIQRKFKKEELTFEFTNGTKVCLYCSVGFHATGGLKLIVYDADTSFQLGEMERKRREIIQRLETEKLHERNKSLPVPMLPRSIGLITGKDSAAMNDILRTLRDASYGITVYVAESLMQGAKCEASILRALDAMQRLGVDVIAIARGGGGKSELAALDNEAIARRIADNTIPIWTAIGHETDISVLDFVAHTHFKTPTALAEEIARRYREQEISVQRALDRFRREWKHRLEKDYRSFSDNVTGIRQGSRKLHDLASSELHGAAGLLHSHVRSRFAEDRSAIAVFRTSLRNASKRVLDRQQQSLQGSVRTMTTGGRRSMEMAVEALIRNRGRLSEERVMRLLGGESRRLSRLVSEVTRFMASMLRIRSEALRTAAQRLRQGGVPARLRSEATVLAERQRFVLAHDPAQQLKRGYAIVRGREKQYLKSVTAVRPGDDIRIEFHDGLASANIHYTEERKDGYSEDL